MIINKKSHYYLRLFLDLIILNGSFLAAAVISQSLQILLDRPYMFVLMAIMNFVWYFFSNVINFYDDVNVRNFSYQFIKIIRNTVVQALTAVLFIFLAKEDLFTRNFILIYSVLVILIVSIRTQTVKYFLSSIRNREKNLRNLLIIGAGELGKNFKEVIGLRNELGFRLMGFLDDSPKHDDNEIIGAISDLNRIIPEKEIEEVIIALPMYASEQLNDIIKICNRHAVRAHIIPDYFRFLSKKFQVNMIGNFPIITVRSEPLDEFHWRFVKRTFDIIFSSAASLLILTWLYPLIFLLDLFFSRGPVMFLQDRIGAGGGTFKCYKFRTMHTGSSSKENYRPTVEDDPRVTKIGKFLRKSNLDELPQLINVLKGDMSIVGPRPHPIAFHKIYEEMVDDIKIRSWVRPGITGWAQVHGMRGDVPDYDENKKRTIKRIEYDLWYIENWSIWLDIQIILTTVWQMVKGRTQGI